MTKFFTVSSLACCLALSWSIGEAATATKPYAYSMKITTVRPKGSVAEAALKDKTKPSTTPLTPCTETTKQDVFSFQLTYDAGTRKVDKKDPTKSTSTVTDVYLFFYNPAALGIKPATVADPTSSIPDAFYPHICETGNPIVEKACDPKILALVRPAAALSAGQIALIPLADAADIRAGDPEHIYLLAGENLGTGKISESLLRSYMRFDDLPQGLWSLIGVVGPKIDPASTTPPTPVDFLDQTNWAAWDSASFMLGSPWQNKKTCQ